MRFHHSKHNPNVVVRNKLYKSDKKWILVSSLAFASGLVFLGTSVTNVNADAVGYQSEQTETVSTPQPSNNIASGQIATDDNTGSKWYIDSNYTLHIGTGVLKGTGSPDTSVWGQYSDSIKKVVLDPGVKAVRSNVSYLFYKMPELESVDLNNIDLSSAYAANMFSYGDDYSDKSSKLESVNVSNVTTNEGTTVTGMFQNCSSLKSLDLSKFAFSSTLSENMLNGTDSLTTLTLTNKVSLMSSMIQSGKESNSAYHYLGFQSGNIRNNYSDFLSLYDGSPKSDNEGVKTWEAIPLQKTKYRIKYYYHDADSDKDVYLGDKYDKTGAKYPREGDPIGLDPSLPGYLLKSSDGYLDIPEGQYKDLYDDNHFVLKDVVLKKCDPEKIIVNNYDIKNDKKKEISSVDLIINDTQNNSKKLDNFYAEIPSVEKIDFDNTTIGTIGANGESKIIKLSDIIEDHLTYNQYLQIINSENQTPNEDGTFDNLPEDMTPQYFVKLVCTKQFQVVPDVMESGTGSSLVINVAFKNDQNVDNNNSNSHSHSHGNSNTTTNTGTIVKQNQDVATTTKIVSVYNSLGKLVTNRALAANTDWFSDEKYTLNYESYYRVASNEYVKVSDVYVYVSQKNIVRVHDDRIGYLVDSKGNKITNRALKESTDWITDRYTMINGEKYYRVATNEFVNESYVSLV